MKFEKKTFEQIDAMNNEELSTYKGAEQAHLDKLANDRLEKAISNAKESTDLEIKSLKDGMKIQSDLIKDFGGLNIGTVENQVVKFIGENADKIKDIFTQGHGVVQFDVTKAVGEISTASASLPVALTPAAGLELAPPSDVNLRGTFVETLVTNISTASPVYAYSDTLPKDGDFSFLAEGASKPQIDFEIQTRYATPVKIAAWERLTTEAVQDIPRLQSIATDFLRKKHDLKKQNGILFGDGVAPNPKGATTYGRVFSAGGMALGVVNPNIMDVINACVTDVYTTHNYVDEMAYQPTLAILNPEDFYLQFVSAKNSDGNPLYPTASLFNRVNIGGMTIMPERAIPVGKIFVADMSKYNTTNYIGYTVKIGYVNDDFIKNQFVILGESRFHAFVKTLDEQAFIYDDIATIKTAITAA